MDIFISKEISIIDKDLMSTTHTHIYIRYKADQNKMLTNMDDKFSNLG